MAARTEIAGAATALAVLCAAAAVLATSGWRDPLSAVASQALPVVALGAALVASTLASVGARRRAAATGALAVGLVVATWISVARLPIAPTEIADAMPLRVASLNLLNQNRTDPDEIVRSMMGLDADVLSLMEAHRIAERIPEIKRDYPWSIGCEDTARPCDSIVLSRMPILEGEQDSLSSVLRDRYIRVVVETPAGPATFVSVHMVKSWYDTFAFTEISSLTSRLRDVHGPLVVAGDLNAAPWSSVVTETTSRNDLMRHASMPASWPVGMGDAGIAIDHLFVRDAGISRLQGVVVPGSNHRGLVADVLVPAGG